MFLWPGPAGAVATIVRELTSALNKVARMPLQESQIIGIVLYVVDEARVRSLVSQLHVSLPWHSVTSNRELDQALAHPRTKVTFRDFTRLNPPLFPVLKQEAEEVELVVGDPAVRQPAVKMDFPRADVSFRRYLPYDLGSRPVGRVHVDEVRIPLVLKRQYNGDVDTFHALAQFAAIIEAAFWSPKSDVCYILCPNVEPRAQVRKTTRCNSITCCIAR